MKLICVHVFYCTPTHFDVLTCMMHDKIEDLHFVYKFCHAYTLILDKFDLDVAKIKVNIA
jgi:hypothetical protein